MQQQQKIYDLLSQKNGEVTLYDYSKDIFDKFSKPSITSEAALDEPSITCRTY